MISAAEVRAEQLLFRLQHGVAEYAHGEEPSQHSEEKRPTESKRSSNPAGRKPARHRPKNNITRDYVSPYITKAQQAAAGRAVYAQQRIRQERQAARTAAELAELKQRGAVAKDQTFLPSSQLPDSEVRSQPKPTHARVHRTHVAPVKQPSQPSGMTIRNNSVRKQSAGTMSTGICSRIDSPAGACTKARGRSDST